MGLELIKHYEDASRKEHPYTHLLQVKIPSLGDRYGFRVPDLLLTVQFHLNAKGDIVREPKLVFQPDGPNDAQLNFRHHTLEFKYTHSVCRFTVSMDALYGEGVTNKQNLSMSTTLGGEGKGAKGEVQAGAEVGTEGPGTRTTLHARIEGMITAKENRLDCWGELV